MTIVFPLYMTDDILIIIIEQYYSNQFGFRNKLFTNDALDCATKFNYDLKKTRCWYIFSLKNSDCKS